MAKSDWVEATWDCDYERLAGTEGENGPCSEPALWAKEGVGWLCQVHYEAYVGGRANG